MSAKYPGIDVDDMIKIQTEALNGKPLSVQGEGAQAYYDHVLEFAKEVEAKGGQVQIPNPVG